MIRFIILFAVGYLAYRALKARMIPKTTSMRSVAGNSTGKIDDVMIKDPYCDAYFPQRNGVHLELGGKDLYFCSDRCRDEYLVAHSEKES